MTILMVGIGGQRILTPLAPPPISYMKERGVFQPLPSMMNPLGLCRFYRADPANASMLSPLKPPATANMSRVSCSLQKMQQRLYIIVVFQGGPITPLGLLQELHTWSTLARIPIYRSDETKDGHKPCMSCCPFCAYTIQNDLAYLNHIVGAHYNANFTCGACLSAITSSGQQMKRHINECSRLAPLPMTSQESVRSERSPKKSASGSKHAGSKKKGRHSEKSQPAGSASQEDSQAGDRHVTHVAGASQESTAESSRHHSQHKKKVKTHKEKKSRK